MDWLSKSTKRLLVEMSVGIVLYNLFLVIVAGLFLPKTAYPVMPVIKGLFVGALGAILMLIHMAVTTERVLDSQNPGYANKYTVMHSMIRKIVFVAAIFFCWRALEADLLAAAVGAMGMKAGAYLQPLIHKAFGWKEEEPVQETSMQDVSVQDESSDTGPS